MISINLTLVIQGIHFGIAYILLNRFLLKPIVHLIQQEESNRNALKQVIAQSEQQTKYLQEQDALLWKQLRQELEQQVPVLEDEIPPTLSKQFRPYVVGDTSLDRYRKELEQYVAEKVRHVC